MPEQSVKNSAFIRSYRRRNQRQENTPDIAPTDRDIAIIDAVYRCRALTQAQIEQLVLGGKHNTYVQTKLADLYHRGYVYRHFLPTPYGTVSSPIVYVLDEKGAALLRKEYARKERDELIRWTQWQKNVKRDFLTHTLEINDVQIALKKACATTAYEIQRWVGEHEVKAKYDRVTFGGIIGKKETAPILPDSYFIVADTTAQKTPLHFFLELDRGTMQQHRFQTKIRAYMAYLKSGAYARRYGTRSFRLLTVTEGEKRCKYLKAATEAVGGQSRFWFTSLKNLQTHNACTAPIWQVAGRAGTFPLIENTVNSEE